jgi:hypothetical protein
MRRGQSLLGEARGPSRRGRRAEGAESEGENQRGRVGGVDAEGAESER